MAELISDKESLEKLKTIGMPPYSRARDVGQLFKIVKKYEHAYSTPGAEFWFEVSPPYDNKKDEQNRSDGDDYSFVNYTGDLKLGVPSMSATINLMRDILEFKIPVYFIQGAEDILTPKEKTAAYYNKIKAPEKKYYLWSKAGHGFNVSVVEMQYKIFKSIKTN